MGHLLKILRKILIFIKYIDRRTLFMLILHCEHIVLNKNSRIDNDANSRKMCQKLKKLLCLLAPSFVKAAA